MSCSCKDTNGKQVYSKCAGQNGGPGTQALGGTWCCTNKIPVKDVCGDKCLDSDSFCGGKVKDNDEFKHDDEFKYDKDLNSTSNDTKDVKVMKIKESKLINIIKTTINRVMVESKHSGSYMAKKQLWGIAEKAQEMAERLQDDTQLEDWMESHIAKADSMMDSVYDSFDYDNQMDTPELFPGTMDALDSLTIREQEEIIALHKQDTSYRDQETGAVVASTQMLDRMDTKLDGLSDKVNDIYDNLSRRWN